MPQLIYIHIKIHYYADNLHNALLLFYLGLGPTLVYS